MLRWPVHADRDGACRPVDRVVLDPQIRVNLAARQFPQPLARDLDTLVRGQLEWNRIQYLLQDGV